jgi:hypothetical protein
MDVDSIAPGVDFRGILNERLESADLMLVLIGPSWLDAKDPGGHRRLENPADFVRQEIAAALKRNIRVAPVLVQGAQMPAHDQLPEALRDLAFRNAFELSHTRWESDVRELVKRLGLGKAEEVPQEASAAQSEASPTHSVDATDSTSIQVGDRFPTWMGLGLIGLFVVVGVLYNMSNGRNAQDERPAATGPSPSPSARGGFDNFKPDPVTLKMDELKNGVTFKEGTVYRSDTAGSAAECSNMCFAENKCWAMTFDGNTGICSLYTNMDTGGRVASPNITSAIKYVVP